MSTPDERPPQIWSYEVYEVDVSPATFGEQARFVEIWQEKRALSGNMLPARSDFDPMTDFREWLGWLNIEEILSRHPYNASFHLFGTKQAEFYGADWTGKTIREIPDDFFTEEEYAHNERIITETKIGMSWGPIKWNNQEWKKATIIELLLSVDGLNPDYVLSLLTPIK